MEKNDKKIIINKELKETTCEVVDDLGGSIKDASRKIFNVLMDQTADIFSDTWDRVLNKAKEKIQEQEEDNNQ